MPLLPSGGLFGDDNPALSRRAHLVLTFLLSFYVHTLPPDVPILIPKALSIPLLQVSRYLVMPPVVTYSDTVLYNWNTQVSSKRGSLFRLLVHRFLHSRETDKYRSGPVKPLCISPSRKHPLADSTHGFG
ncbi:hypothetical protein E1B28_010884 [Marasmius oreades]|uniref:Uncharacterized protein n=1 Tax=Marasmius oreades TaxID=181124 RepID=A0A9P7RTH2_9AGAR|nr:uncharacterized protein E1B28_010884 [Marasmius oreades]KAG7089182.1 hypothetical protein E1B28_010884 [Marasmius oreades]